MHTKIIFNIDAYQVESKRVKLRSYLSLILAARTS
jgi:hypothetical protein